MGEEGDRGAQAFTLIELLLALALFSMILVVVYGAFSHIGEVKDRVSARAEMIRAGEIFLTRLEAELVSAYVLPLRDGMGRITGIHPTTIFLGVDHPTEIPEDELTLTTGTGEELMILPPGAEKAIPTQSSPHEEIGYLFLPDPYLARPPLSRRYDNTLDDNPLEGGVTDRLWSQIVGLNFRYLDPRDRQWKDAWDARTRPDSPLPRAVEITLYLGDPKKKDLKLSDLWVVGETILLPRGAN
jgi:prepilin-type N-terminal cleavage/methylation domain-containing protein